jgi:hypothetical protein
VMYRPSARQQLSKHIPTGAKGRNNRTSITRRRINKEAALTIEAIFSEWSCKEFIKKGTVENSQLSEVERVQLKKSSFVLELSRIGSRFGDDSRR